MNKWIFLIVLHNFFFFCNYTNAQFSDSSQPEIGRALELVKNSTAPEQQRDACLQLSIIFEKKGDIEKSLKYYMMYISFKDSIMNASDSASIANIQIKYETEKKEQQIALLNKNKQIQLTEISKQKSQRNAFIGGFILVLLLASILFNRYYIQEKANREIEQTLKHLKDKQEQLIQQGKLASLGKMTARVAVEIQNPVIEIKDLSADCEDVIVEFENTEMEGTRSDLLERLKANLAGIIMHGRNADDIVKDVLMKSRK